MNPSRKPQQGLSERGFDPRTFGLWAQHASHCATPLDANVNRNSHRGIDAQGPADGQGESGWCLVRTSTPEAWGHAGVRFLLLGESALHFCGRINMIAAISMFAELAIGCMAQRQRVWPQIRRLGIRISLRSCFMPLCAWRPLADLSVCSGLAAWSRHRPRIHNSPGSNPPGAGCPG